MSNIWVKSDILNTTVAFIYGPLNFYTHNVSAVSLEILQVKKNKMAKRNSRIIDYKNVSLNLSWILSVNGIARILQIVLFSLLISFSATEHMEPNEYFSIGECEEISQEAMVLVSNARNFTIAMAFVGLQTNVVLFAIFFLNLNHRIWYDRSWQKVVSFSSFIKY